MQPVEPDEGLMKDLPVDLKIVDQEVAVSDHVADQRPKGKNQGGDTDDQGDHPPVVAGR